MVTDNKIPDGYKQTEVGVIPEDWEVICLGEIFDFKNGLNKAKEYFGHGSPIVNYMDVYKNRGLFAKDILGTVDVTKQEIKAYQVLKHDVFFTRTSETVEEVGLSSVILDDIKDTVFSGFVLRARPKNNVLCATFKKYCFSSLEVRKKIVSKSSYTTRALTNGRLLSEVTIPVPPLPEQTAIANVLSDVDSVITSLDKVIAKKKNIKQGAMQELLTGKKQLPGFSGEWKVKKLGEVLSIRHGKSQQKIQIRDGKYPILATSGVIGLTNTFIYDKPSVLIGRKGTIDKPQFQDTPFWTIDTLFYSEIFLNNCPKFIYYKFLIVDWYSCNEASGVPSLKASTIENIELIFPSLPEQQSIAQILSDMDTEINQLEKKRDKYKDLKQAMMQQLLTGKIRLV